MSDKHDKKHAKKLQQKKNRKRFIINKQLEDEEAKREEARERDEALREAAKKSGREAAQQKVTRDEDGNPVWSAKMQEVKNRVSGKKRMAKDRWNRFAGTSGAGAMGR